MARTTVRTMTRRAFAFALAGLLALTLPPLLWRASLAAAVARDVRLLGSPEEPVRQAAHGRLVRLRPASVPLVIAAFADAADAWEPGKPPPDAVPGTVPLTIPIMTWLRTLGDPEIIDALIEALGDDESDVRHSAALTLAWLGEAAMPRLVDTLRHADDPRRRVSAAWIVSFLGPAGHDALPALQEALDDPDKDLRYTARYAIAEIGAVDDARAQAIDAGKQKEHFR
jgi:HEAT repeat protein